MKRSSQQNIILVHELYVKRDFYNDLTIWVAQRL